MKKLCSAFVLLFGVTLLGQAPAVLTQSDLTLLGYFDFPSQCAGSDDVTNTLAMKYIGGKRWFFSMEVGSLSAIYGHVFRVSDPGPLGDGGAYTTTPPYPVAVCQEDWGRPGGNFAYINNPSPVMDEYGAIYVEPATGRLWYSKFDHYNNVANYDTSFGVTTMNDVTHNLTNGNYWGLNNLSVKYNATGFTQVPGWWLTGYGLPTTRTLGIGFGGGDLGNVATGPASMGPSLSAVDPPATTQAVGLVNTFKALLNFPNTGTPQSAFHGRHAETSYVIDPGIAWELNPSGSTGYFNDASMWRSAAAWADTTNVSGLLVLAKQAEGTLRTTVLDSPAPTTSVFSVAAVGDLRKGDAVAVCTPNGIQASGTCTEPGGWELQYIASVSGNQITLAAPLAGLPKRPGAVQNIVTYAGGPFTPRSWYWFLVYSPADLGAVAQNIKQPYEVNASSQWQVNFPIDTATAIAPWGFTGTYPMPGEIHNTEYLYSPVGAVYDATAKQYIACVTRASNPSPGLDQSMMRYRCGVWGVR